MEIFLYLYKVDRLKLRLRNLATCSSARLNTGIKATEKTEKKRKRQSISTLHGATLSIQSRKGRTNNANESGFTLEVKI